MIPLTELLTGDKPRSVRARLSESKGRGLSSPSVAVINLTLRCALRCVYCYSSAGSLKDLSCDIARAFLSEFSQSGGRVVILSGGEPTLYPDVADVVNECAKLGLVPTLSSCGMCSLEVLRRLVEYGVKYVGVSVDTGIPFLESKIRRGSDIEKIVDTIRELRRLGVDVGVRATLTVASLPVLERLLKLCSRLDVYRLCIYFLVPSGRARELSTLSVDGELAVRAMLYLFKVVRRHPLIDVLLVTNPSAFLLACLYSSSSKEEFLKLAESYSARCRCNAARGIVSLNVRGELLPCQFSPPEFSCGFILSTDLRTALKTGKEIVERYRCRACELADLCYGCPVRLYVHSVDADPLCVVRPLSRFQGALIDDWKISLIKRMLRGTQYRA